MNERNVSPQQERENSDPHENTRPVPWFLIVLVATMVAFGIQYISTSSINAPAEWGDGRTEAELAGSARAGAAADGASIYASRCAACHQANGAGLPGVFPPLAGSEWVSGKGTVLAAILLHGVSGPLTVKGMDYNGTMPAFKDQLGDTELAALATYIRKQWGNTGDPVTRDTFAEVRRQSQSRSAAFKGGAELAALE